MAKERLDRLLVSLGLAETRSQAQGFVLAGLVRVNGRVVTKAGQPVQSDASIDIKKPKHDYVSRAGGKLAGALNQFNVQVAGKRVLDCGISTGGFSDCMLRRGAEHVYGVDVGYGDVAWSVRNNPAVTLIERTNLRYLLDKHVIKPALKEEILGKLDLVTLDLSFISVRKVLPVVEQLLKEDGELLTLVKPQFELQKADIGKGGIVRDTQLHRRAVEGVRHALEELEFEILGESASEVVGTNGNQEFFLYAAKRRKSE